MTADQRAAMVYDFCFGPHAEKDTVMTTAIAHAIREAEAAMKERCAEVAGSAVMRTYETGYEFAGRIKDSIRALP